MAINFSSFSFPATNINRDILECKCVIMTLEADLLTDINRDILECKSSSTDFLVTEVLILIETYWNVNLLSSDGRIKGNKNINRDILECKF